MDPKQNPAGRGTVIKLPSGTPGVVFVNGTQLPFVVEGMWRSSVAPAVNMIVDVHCDDAGAIVGLVPLDATQLATEQGRDAVQRAKRLLGIMATRMGKVALASAVALWIAWFFLPAISFGGLVSLTFWDLVSSGSGFFVLLGLLAISAPFAAPFIKHARARWLYSAPLAYLVLTFIRVAATGRELFGLAGSLGGRQGEKIAADVTAAAMGSALDFIGYGFYAMVAAALILGLRSLKAPATA